jgi:signal transduction histidine kinase/ActR/RegA family two-component response regulator
VSPYTGSSTNACVIALDREWRLTFANETAVEFLGTPGEVLTGARLWDRFPDVIGSELEHALRRSAAEGSPASLEWFHPRLGRWMEVVIIPTAGMLAVSCQDVSERRARTEERELDLKERATQLENEREANRVKDDFLATVSHELRTPLNAILGWCRLLRTGDLDEEKRTRALETIERNAAIQAQLLEDLLDVSRIISGKLRIELVSVDLGRCVEAAVEACRPSAVTKAIALDTSLGSDLPRLRGDPDRLQQVVWNLVTNAIKFTPERGRVKVKVSTVPGRVRIVVTDDGEGITADFLPFVFDRFAQADTATTRANKGLGLGLAIVSHLVQLHGGTVAAASEGAGRGATFTVELPVPTERLPTPDSGTYLLRATAAPAPRARLDRIHILVVDDEPDARELLVEILSPHGPEVTAAGSVAEALSLVDLDWPHVLVSDLAMPGEDGYALLAALRQRAARTSRRIPALALSAYARAEDRRRALAAGFDGHLAKPVDPAALITAVVRLVGRSASNSSSS